MCWINKLAHNPCASWEPGSVPTALLSLPQQQLDPFSEGEIESQSHPMTCPSKLRGRIQTQAWPALRSRLLIATKMDRLHTEVEDRPPPPKP